MQKIRLFEPGDMFSVIKLASMTLTEQYNPSIFNYFYETFPEGFIVAEKNHKIVGFILGVITNRDIAKILMISVDDKFRRQKIGKELLSEFINIIKNKNLNIIELEVRIDNISAIKFYEKHNFKIVNKLTQFYQNGEDAYTMKLIV